MRIVASERAEEASARIMSTLAYGLVSIEQELPDRLLPPRSALLADPRHSMVLPHIVAIAEEFSRAVLVAGSEAIIGPLPPLVQELWEEGRRQAEGAWSQHLDAWNKWHGMNLKACPEWSSVDSFNEIRNSIMHGLGKLTRRQLGNDGGKNIIAKCERVGVQVRGGNLLITNVSLRTCATACRGFVLWLDRQAESVGVAA